MSIDKPNILIIHADEHRADCLGVHGNKDIQTPHIDGLARDGVTFRNCFSTFPLCTPARHSLLTGLYVHQHLGWTNQCTIPPGIATFPRILKEKGYQTACVGKMHFTPSYADYGFDEMFLAEQDGPGRYDDDYHRYLMDKWLIDWIDMQDQVGEFRSKAPPEYTANFGTDPSNLPEAEYSTTWIANRACEVISSWQGGGHMLLVGFIKPHHPFDAPPPWSDKYDPVKLTLLPGWTDACLPLDRAFSKGHFDYSKLTPEKMKVILAKYYASISQIDHHVGHMVALLKKMGLYENTMIIYTSDHGDFMGHHHMILKANYMYDPEIRVPLVVKYPGDAPKGVVEEKLVSIIDTTATILDVAGCLIPKELWESVAPLRDADRDAVFAEDNQHNYMVRTRDRKLLLCPQRKSQFFDLTSDPHELTNLFDDPKHQAEISQLKERLLRWLAFETPPPLHVDEGGPVGNGPNVQTYMDPQHKKVEGWLKQKMREQQSR